MEGHISCRLVGTGIRTPFFSHTTNTPPQSRDSPTTCFIEEPRGVGVPEKPDIIWDWEPNPPFWRGLLRAFDDATSPFFKIMSVVSNFLIRSRRSSDGRGVLPKVWRHAFRGWGQGFASWAACGMGGWLGGAGWLGVLEILGGWVGVQTTPPPLPVGARQFWVPG